MILKRALPFLCFICGLAGAYNIDSAPSFYPGILLMLIACIIWMKKLENLHDHISYSESTQKLVNRSDILKFDVNAIKH